MCRRFVASKQEKIKTKQNSSTPKRHKETRYTCMWQNVHKNLVLILPLAVRHSPFVPVDRHFWDTQKEQMRKRKPFEPFEHQTIYWNKITPHKTNYFNVNSFIWRVHAFMMFSLSLCACTWNHFSSLYFNSNTSNMMTKYIFRKVIKCPVNSEDWISLIESIKMIPTVLSVRVCVRVFGEGRVVDNTPPPYYFYRR